MEQLSKESVFDELKEIIRTNDALSETMLGHLEIDLFENIESTNSFLLNKQPSTRTQVCISESQSSGRGRFGRNWHSPKSSNIYFSISFHKDVDAIELSGLSLVIGIVVTELLQSYCTIKLSVKWPNDVLANAKKLAGILIELKKVHAQGNVPQWKIVVGVGINISLATTINEIDQPYISLQDCDLVKPINRNNMIASLISSIDSALVLFMESGLSTFIERWNNLDSRFGEQIELIAGTRIIGGRHLGIDQTGALLIENDDGIRAWTSGEVRIKKAEL